MKKIEKAIKEIRKGNFVLVYDGDEREGEVDFIMSAKSITSKRIEFLRKKAGGLICVAIGNNFAKKIGLKFMDEILKDSGYGDLTTEKTPYGEKTAFTITINHRKTFTGITDKDRAKTIKMISRAVEEKWDRKRFSKEFYAPGHVHLLISRGIKKRQGHTEIGVYLMEKAGLPKAAVLCEFLDSGKAMNKKKAKTFAKRNNLAFIEGKEVIECC